MPLHPGLRLRELLAQTEIAVLPGVHDAFSAKLAQLHGFQALMAGGNAATGSLLGLPDMGQLSLRDLADHYTRIAAAVETPVLVDADTGFGGVHNVVQTVQAFERSGAAGLFMEDQVTPKRCGYLAGKAVIPVADQVAKLRAALDARREPAFVLCARTDALAVEGVDAAIERALRYKETGVDMIFVQGADTPELLHRVCAAIPGPHLSIISQASSSNALSVATAQQAGASAIMFPIAAMLAAAGAMDRMLANLQRDHSLAASELMPMARYNEITGLAEAQAREDRWNQTNT